MECPICHVELENGICPLCTGKSIPYDMIDKIEELPLEEENVTKPIIQTTEVPGVLWVLPVIFALPGGIISAVIANACFRASGKGYLAVGLLISILGVIIYLIAIDWINNL